MLSVLRIAQSEFALQASNDLEARFRESPVTMEAVRRMTGREKRELLRRLGVPRLQELQLLRALQHCAAAYTNPTVDSASGCIPHRSAHAFSPLALMEPLTGYYEPLSAETGMDAAAERSMASPRGSHRAVHGAVGLRNQGATCYLNSLMQALYHLPRFRSHVFGLEVDEADGATCMQSALQLLFATMSTSDAACETTTLTRAFGWDDGDAFYQQDISELCTLLLDSLSERLVATKKENFVKNLFYGRSRSSFVVLDRDYTRHLNPEEFHAITTVVKGCKNIYESLDHTIEPVHLTGSNKYCLEGDDGTKSYHDARKDTYYEALPPVLFINVQRTEYDVVRGTQHKLMSRWEFYDEIELGKYFKHDNGNAAEKSVKYRLHAVLVHSGHDARHGHYYAFVRVGDKWLKFNDESVDEATPSQVFGDNFGGSGLNYWGCVANQAATAYMLIYVRVEAEEELFVSSPVAIPRAVEARWLAHQQATEAATRERAAAHLYTFVSVLGCAELREQPQFLRKARTDRRECRREDKRATVEAVLAGRPETLSSSSWSVWTCAAREDGVRVDQRVDPATPMDELPRLYPHTFPTIFVFPATSNRGFCFHKFFDAKEGVVRFIDAQPLSDTDDERIFNFGETVAQKLDLAPDDIAPVMETSDHHVAAISDIQTAKPGDVYVWYVERDQDPFAFYHFLRHKVTVKLFSIEFRKGWPHLATIDIADDLTYAETQEKVAAAIGCDKPTHLRFCKHNPETGCPRPQRLPCNATTRLRHMITMPDGKLYDRIYVDICEVPAVEADSAKYVRFEVFSDAVKYVSTHGVVLPQEFTHAQLIKTCCDQAKIEDVSEEKPYRLLDVWKGRVYAKYDMADTPFTDKVQDMADYRLEACPRRVEDAPADAKQREITVFHISRNSTASTGFTAHSDPFSLFVLESDTVDQAKERIATKLKLPVETVAAWKSLLAYSNDLIELDGGKSLCAQIDGADVADTGKLLLALEHTPLPGTRANTYGRREEGVKLRS